VVFVQTVECRRASRKKTHRLHQKKDQGVSPIQLEVSTRAVTRGLGGGGGGAPGGEVGASQKLMIAAPRRIGAVSISWGVGENALPNGG